jgi:hypothetical protein
MSRVIPYGKRFVKITDDYFDVIVSGATYPFRNELREKFHAKWDPSSRHWTIRDMDFDDVEEAMINIIEKYEEANAGWCKDEFEEAVNTRRMREGRWTNEEQESLKRNYSAWKSAGGIDEIGVTRYGWQSLCRQCKRPLFRVIPDKSITKCACGCVFCD